MTKEQEFSPLSNCAGGFYINSRENSVNYAENLKKFKDIRNCPFVLDSKLIKEGVAVVLQACLDAFPKVMNQTASDEIYARSSFSDIQKLIEGEVENFKTVARDHIGTHTGKIPNPSVSGPGGLLYSAEIFKEASKLSHVSSATINAGQRLGAAGNAAQNRAQRFLSATFSIDGVPVSVFEDVGKKGQIFDALVSLGFPKSDIDEVADIINHRYSSVIDEKPGLNSKGLLWPTPHGDVVITPVHPYAMTIELSSRLKNRFAAGRIVHNTWIKIGGTKPQNAGLVNNDLGGVHRLLKSIPPKRTSRIGRLAFKAGVDKSLPFAVIGKNHPTMDLLRAVLADKRLNAELARKQDHAINRLVALSLYPWIEFSALVAEGDERSIAALAGIHDVQRKLLENGFKALTLDERLLLADQVADKVMKLDHGMSGDSYRNQIHNAAESFFKNQF